MKSLYVVLLACCVGVVACSHEPVIPNRPLPKLVPASGSWQYSHWECPEGWRVETRYLSKIVYCDTDEEANRRMENYERELKPTVNP